MVNGLSYIKAKPTPAWCRVVHDAADKYFARDREEGRI
jgi:hypothetical protein